MLVSRALNPRRIARSLVTVLTLTLLEIVVAPVVAPVLTSPKAEAVDVPYTGNTSGYNIVVPAGVFSITLTARGAAGGTGGNDGSALGLASSNVGSVSGTFDVTPGDRIVIYPGGVGGAGVSGLSSAAGGTAGATSVYVTGSLTTAFRFNGVLTDSIVLNGGVGGAAGSGGSSGGGGGGGAATLVAINDSVALLAGGGGGGGGGSGAGAQPWSGTYTANGTNPTGANGTSGGGCGNTDGGGSGAGGGGWYGGAGGVVDRPGNAGECRAFTGSAGGNFVASNGTSTANSYVTANGEGAATYVFNYSATTTCVQDTQTNDIYTIVKITTTAECNWTVPSSVNVIDLFLVGGGGGGAGDAGPGGGGGAVLSRTAIAVAPSSTMKLKVGYGGAGSGWTYVQGAYRGDSTTVVTSTGALYYALGGTVSATGPTATVTGNQAVQSGSFDGGIGGIATNTTNSVGGTGKAGVSNYFYGTQNTYSGGGGGGCYFSKTYGTSVSGAAGANGGGSGCSYNNSTGRNSNGNNGEANRGGGGGAGGAGDAIRTIGGKGGSGVILIRYATNAADSFPAALSSALAGRYMPGDLQLLDSSRKGWIDSSGTNASVSNANITSTGLSIVNQGTSDGVNSTGSSKSLLAVQGSTSSKVTFQDLNTGYTLFHIARYITGGNNRRMFSAKDSNWLSGFYYGVGATHHTAWLTNDSRNIDYKWQLSSDQALAYRNNGVDYAKNDDSIGTQATSASNFGINNWATTGEESDFQVNDVIIFNRALTIGEIRLMELYLSRVDGLQLSPYFNTSETDTAYLGTSTYSYFFQQQDARNNLNDTFTVEAWLKPDTTCNTNVCTYFAREGSVRMTVRNGKLSFILNGDGGWEWINDVVPIPSGEWHHVAIAKTLPGNNNNSVKVYLDGKLVFTKAGSPYRASTTAVPSPSNSATLTQVTTWGYIGVITGGTERWYGNIDEFKVWKVARSQSDIASDMYSNDGSDPNLQMYYNMNYISGTHVNQFKIPNLAYYGHSRSDLFNWDQDTISFSDVKTVSTSGPYTTVTFPRSYITQYGGWKVPSGISLVQAALVGGGGGAGGGYQGGGGGAGGLIETLTTLTSGTIYPITVGVGGNGHSNVNPATTTPGTSFTAMPTNGDTSTAFGLSAIGGGYGSSEFDSSTAGGSVNINRIANSGGSGGGGGWTNGLSSGAVGTPGQGNAGGNIPGCCTAAGGGGAGSLGSDGTISKGGDGGSGKFSTVLQKTVAAGGGGSMRTGTTTASQGLGGSGIGGNSGYTNNAAVGATGGATNGAYGTGSGGGAGMSSNGTNASYSGSGGTGVVAIRYITALVPTYTKPSNAYLNVGMIESFTTNVAADSATAGLTRTFKWESTAPAANGAYTTLKVGTGAANAAYSWVPSDTSTSGSGYLYRLTVTDSDTAGLFITDSSTAYAVINPALKVTSTAASNQLAKRINISRSETYTITLGTPTYRATLTPILQGVTIDTSTAGVVVLKIGDTATVGTWAETLTVTDSVSAVYNVPLSITVVAPPHLLNTNEIVSNGLKLNLDAGNSASFIDSDSATASNSYQWKDLSGNGKNASTGGTYDGSNACVSPQYSTLNGGQFVLNGTSQCFNTPNLGDSFTAAFTAESWFKSGLATMNSYGSLISQYQSGTSTVAYMLGDYGSNKISISSYGSNWNICYANSTVTQGKWTHAVGTYDGSKLRIYINGVLENTCTVSYIPATPTTYGTWIGRRWDSSNYFNGSIATARVYNRALSETEVAQNFNATKYRFDVSNQTLIKPTKKYGVLNLESFTATSGLDTKTVSFAVGDRLGIDWDTTTVANQVNLSIQESLSASTYYDTMTVTDSLGQSTYLPIKFTVTQADTLTVYVDTPTALNYTGSQAIFTQTLKTSGAVGLEIGASVSATVKFKPGGGTCASGGYCRVGDIGPAGGIIFIDTSTAGSDGRIYEAAPYNWSGSDDLATVAQYCSNNNLNIGATQFGIGWGDTNTTLAKNACLGGAVAKVNSFNQSNSTGYTDWFIPDTNEAIELIKYRDQIGLVRVGSNWSTGTWGYWTSTEVDAANQRSIGGTGTTWNVSSSVAKSESTRNMVRPVRAFKSCWAIDTCTAQAVTTIPTSAGLYSIVPSAASVSTGSLSNYVAVNYQPTPLTINKIAPKAINIPWINTVYPDTFTVNISIYAGSGALKFSAVNGTANGCAMDYKKIYTTSQGTCAITVTRYADRNYLGDTTTGTILFLAFVNSQPTNQVGSGTTIALNGKTSLTIDDSSTVRAPRITGFDISSLGMTIYGEGFGSVPVTVIFERYVSTTGIPGMGGTVLSVTTPADAQSGPVVVITSGGRDSIDWVDIPRRTAG